MGASEEVTEIYEFAVGLIFDYKVLAWKTVSEELGIYTIDDTPLVLATADVPAVDDHSSL